MEIFLLQSQSTNSTNLKYVNEPDSKVKWRNDLWSSNVDFTMQKAFHTNDCNFWNILSCYNRQVRDTKFYYESNK